MAKSITTDQRTAFNNWHVVVVFFVELALDSGTRRYSTMAYDMTWGGNPWLGMGIITNIEPIKENITLTATGLKISLTGVPSDIVSLALQEPIQGRTCRVWVGVLNKDTLALIDTPIQEYKGLLNVPLIEDDDGEGVSNVHSSSVSLSVEGRLADMFRPNTRRYTDADQQKYYPNDLIFQYMPQMSEKVAIWPGIGWQQR